MFLGERQRLYQDKDQLAYPNIGVLKVVTDKKTHPLDVFFAT